MGSPRKITLQKTYAKQSLDFTHNEGKSEITDKENDS